MGDTDTGASVSGTRGIVVMGVAGCGKTSVGLALARRLDVAFIEGDDFHPAENVAKMSAGQPLTDLDRWPWLDALGGALRASNSESPWGVVASCSALRRAYRERLAASANVPLVYVLLDVPRDVLRMRLDARKDHYMPASLLDSQLATLELPDPDEPVITISNDADVDSCVCAILRRLGV